MFRFGIIGAAKIAHKFVKSAERLPGVCVAAVSSKSLDRAAAFAAEEGIPAAYGSDEEMLLKERLDAVYIATTMNFHYENTMLALKHRIPVLCEKALTDSAAHAGEMFRYAEEQKTFLMEGVWSLFTPKTRKVREWVLSGRIGKVNLIQANIGFVPEKDPESRYFNPALGGGAMLDLGAYMTAVPAFMVGKEITDYSGRTVRGFNGIDEKIFLNLQLEDVLCNVIGSLDSVLPEECLIAGDRGYIRIPRYHSGTQAYLYNAQYALEESFSDTESVGFEYEMEEVLRCIREGKTSSDIASPGLSIRCAEIFDWFRGRLRT